MNLTPQSAIMVVMLVTFLWGSWFQVVKHTGSYPIVSFIRWLYTFSVPVVWGAILLLQDRLIPGGALAEIAGDIPRSLLLLACGAVFAAAMQLQLTVVGRIGLILSTSVSATCCILCGTLVSSFFGGIPEGTSFASIFFASVLLVLATITCQYAGVRRDGETKHGGAGSVSSRGRDIALLVFINSVLMSSYPLATSVGIRSPLNPGGMSSLTCMGVVVVGAFLGSNVFAALSWRKSRMKMEAHKSVHMGKILLLAFVAACCHFGGNILHSLAAPVLSIAIATAMGNSYHVWSYLWGIFYGEFKGASPKTYGILGVGVGLFLAGIWMLSLDAGV